LLKGGAVARRHIGVIELVVVGASVAMIATARSEELPQRPNDPGHAQLDAIEARSLAGGIVFPIDWRNLAAHEITLIQLDDRGMLVRLRDGAEIWLHPEPSGAWRWLPGQKVEWQPVPE
jgi:hypothetical protein